MSKFNDLKYYLQNLSGEIEDIEDKETRENVQKSFTIVESQIDDIENDLNSIKYDIDVLL